MMILAVSLSGQSIVPAKAGLVSYADEAYIGDRMVEISPSNLVVVNQNAVLRTGAGRAEVLLGPCGAMWIGEKSSFRMISGALTDIRVELLAGPVIVGVGPLTKGTRLSLLKNAIATLAWSGAFRFDAEPPRAEVLAGRMRVRLANRQTSVTAGRLLPLDSLTSPHKFPHGDPDELESWSKSRAALLARLAIQHREDVQPPAPLPTAGDIGEYPGGLGGKVLTNGRPAPAQPLPPLKSAASGCAVAPW